MDVIAIRKVVAAAVAPLGCALTPEQIYYCGSYTMNRCVFRWRYGWSANRALEGFYQYLSRKVRPTAVLPNGKDPDDLIGASGPDEFRKVILTARSLVDSLWERLQSEYELTQPESRAQFWQAVHTRAKHWQ